MSFLQKIICLLVVFFIFINLNAREGIASNGEITLKEAIDIGLDRAKEWNNEAYLTFIISADENMGGTRGKTGKRYNWNLIFGAPGNDQQLFVFISEEEIWGIHKGKGPAFEAVKLDDIKFDSPSLLKIAKKKYDLQIGVDWATGYHFTLDSIDGVPILTVVGNDRNNRFTRISFNAKNGNVVSAIHKLPYGGGLLSKRNGTDNLTKKGMAIMGVVAGNKNLVVWGDKKPTQFSTTKKPFIEMSRNNGRTWTKLKANNYVTHAWFDMNEQLYVATEKELWAGITSKRKGRKILSLEHAIERVDYSINNHIAVLSSGIIYYSTNQGKSWEQATVPKPFYEVQISDNGNLVGLTDDRKIMQKTSNGWNEITMPNGNDTPQNMKVINNRLFISTQSGIWTRNLQEENWRKIEVDEMGVHLIKKGEKLFGITHRGEAIYSINIKDERKSVKVFDAGDFLVVMDVDLMGDTLWIATIPNYSWEEIEE